MTTTTQTPTASSTGAPADGATPPPNNTPAAVSSIEEPSSFGDMLAKTLEGLNLPDAEPVAAPADGSPPPAVAPASAAVPPVTPPADAAAEPPATKVSDEDLAAAEAKMDVKAGTAFRYLKGTLKEKESQMGEMRTRIQQLEAREAEMTGKLGELERLPQMQDTLSRYEQELSISRVEATDEFQRTVAVPLRQVEGGLSELAKKYEVPPSDMQAALHDTNQVSRTDRLAELSSNFNRLDLAKFDRLIGDMDRLEAVKTETLANAKVLADRVAAQQQAAQVNVRKQWSDEWTGAAEKVISSMAKQLPLFSAEGQDAAWKERIEAAQNAVKTLDLPAMPAEEQVAMAYRSQVFPVAVQLVQDLFSENQELEAKLAKYRTATPGAGAGAGATPGSTSPTGDGSFIDEMQRSLGV